jgi:hypothetical protein
MAKFTNGAETLAEYLAVEIGEWEMIANGTHPKMQHLAQFAIAAAPGNVVKLKKALAAL